MHFTKGSLGSRFWFWASGWADIIDGLVVVLSFTIVHTDLHLLAIGKYLDYCEEEGDGRG